MKHDKYSNFENNKVKKNNYSSVSVKTKNKKIKNFNLRYAYKILDSLIKNEEQKLTPLAQNTGINFNRCKNYVVIMENNFEWVKTEKIKHNIIIKMTESGREFLWRLRKLFSTEF